jgi:hypothetical protein
VDVTEGTIVSPAISPIQALGFGPFRFTAEEVGKDAIDSWVKGSEGGGRQRAGLAVACPTT